MPVLRALTLLVLLAMALPLPVAAQEEPGVFVSPDPVDAGARMSILLVFPDDASGDAVLEVGDGRTEAINTAVGEVELPMDAPGQNGTYTARLRYDSLDGQRTHETIYTVGEPVAVDEESPTPLWLTLAALTFLARKHRK